MRIAQPNLLKRPGKQKHNAHSGTPYPLDVEMFVLSSSDRMVSARTNITQTV